MSNYHDMVPDLETNHLRLGHQLAGLDLVLREAAVVAPELGLRQCSELEMGEK
jgi:hypothetical protein